MTREHGPCAIHVVRCTHAAPTRSVAVAPPGRWRVREPHARGGTQEAFAGTYGATIGRVGGGRSSLRAHGGGTPRRENECPLELSRLLRMELR